MRIRTIAALRSTHADTCHLPDVRPVDHRRYGDRCRPAALRSPPGMPGQAPEAAPHVGTPSLSSRNHQRRNTLNHYVNRGDGVTLHEGDKLEVMGGMDPEHGCRQGSRSSVARKSRARREPAWTDHRRLFTQSQWSDHLAVPPDVPGGTGHQSPHSLTSPSAVPCLSP